MDSFKKSYYFYNLWNSTELNNLRLRRLLRTKVYGKWSLYNDLIYYSNNLLKTKINDHDFYINLRGFYNGYIKPYITEETEKNKENRADSRLRDINKYIPLKCNSYLDIGCGDGYITYKISEFLKNYNVNVQTYGIDVKDRRIVKKFNFKCYDGDILPFEDNSLEVITIFMVLHHVKHINILLKEITRVLKDKGVLIIREHHVDTDDLKNIIDIQHNLYQIVWKDNINIHDLNVVLYGTKKKWNKLLKQYELHEINGDKINKSKINNINGMKKVINPFQTYYNKYIYDLKK